MLSQVLQAFQCYLAETQTPESPAQKLSHTDKMNWKKYTTMNFNLTIMKYHKTKTKHKITHNLVHRILFLQQKRDSSHYFKCKGQPLTIIFLQTKKKKQVGKVTFNSFIIHNNHKHKIINYKYIKYNAPTLSVVNTFIYWELKKAICCGQG